MTADAFSIAGLSYRYPRAKVNALREVSLRIPAGATTAVMGLSGSGKSTLLHLLGLLNRRSATPGQVVYRGSDGPVNYAAMRGGSRSRLRRREFGFVLQSAYLLPHLTCAENVAIPLALQGVAAGDRARRVEALLRQVDARGILLGRSTSHPRDVSGGERQRMAVLRAVVHDPRVLFADEPVSNLDPINSRRVLRLIRAWRRGRLHPSSPAGPRTLVLVSHDIDLAYKMARHFVLLRRGRVVGGRTLSRAFVASRGGPDALRAWIGA